MIVQPAKGNVTCAQQWRFLWRWIICFVHNTLLFYDKGWWPD
ncbi:hypothetical protein I656_00094 [Geobacillus sp. WSUCF1]|nr:hypothetical protein I656_00094 [Geobacillus sp. WSUCF1]